MNEWTKERQKAARDLGPEYNMVFGADVGAMLAEIERCWGEIERLTAALEDLRPSEDEPPTPAERVTEDELAAAQKLISALVSVDDAARHLSEEAEISGSPTSPTVEVGYPCWLDLQTALDTIDRGEGHDAPPGAPALTMFDRLAAEVRALHATVESLRRRLDIRTQERDSLLAARPAPATEAPHGDDPCAACTAILGSPQPCAVTHDVGPGAYPVDASLEARAKGAWIASEVRNPNASRWDDLEEAERCGWLAVVRAVDASRNTEITRLEREHHEARHEAQRLTNENAALLQQLASLREAVTATAPDPQREAWIAKALQLAVQVDLAIDGTDPNVIVSRAADQEQHLERGMLAGYIDDGGRLLAPREPETLAKMGGAS